jgi:reactive intermediate/imine deaminase
VTRNPVSAQGMPPAVGPFSAGMVVEGKLVFLSGQGPQDPATGEFFLGDVEQQTRIALDNLTRGLANAGASWANVVRVGIYLADLDDFAAVNRVYRDYVVEPFPARTTIGAPLLMGMKVEIDCVAVL